MSNETTSQTERVQAAAQRLATIEARLERFEADAKPLRDRVASLQAERTETDWILTNPNGGTRYVQARAKRERLSDEMRQINRHLNDLENDYAHVKRERTEAIAELAELRRPPVTVESIQAKIDAAETELDRLKEDRVADVAVIEKAQWQQRQAQNLMRKASEAQQALRDLQRDQFLAPIGPARDAFNGRVEKAETAARDATSKAAGAEAAASTLATQLWEAEAAVEALDQRIAETTAAIARMHNEREAFKARESIALHLAELGKAAKLLRDADPDAGKRLLKAWREEGLQTLDLRGRLVRPDWLSHAAA